MKTINRIIKNLPTLLTALAFAIAVWIYAVSQADPTETQVYPRPFQMEVIGLDPNLTIVNDYADTVSLTLRAPSTIIQQLINDSTLIDVTLDLSGLESGVHTLTPQVNLAVEPAEVVRINPSTIFVKLDSIVTETFPVTVELDGNPAIGFEAKTPELENPNVRVSGPQSLIESIERIVARVDIDEASESIQREVELVAYDDQGIIVDSASITPGTIEVIIPITQRGGYRTVGVKPITTGELAEGYRLLNIFSIPPTVTIYSSDTELVQSLPSSIETTPINLNSAEESMEIRVTLDLPEGVSVVGSQYVTVQIEIEPIIDSRRFADIPVQVEGLAENLQAIISPENVDVILEGPVTVLETLDIADILIVVDLTELQIGTHQVTPEVRLAVDDLTVESILPNLVEVTITF